MSERNERHKLQTTGMSSVSTASAYQPLSLAGLVRTYDQSYCEHLATVGIISRGFTQFPI